MVTIYPLYREIIPSFPSALVLYLMGFPEREFLPDRKCLEYKESLLDRGTLPDYTTVLGAEKVFYTEELFRTENVLNTEQVFLVRGAGPLRKRLPDREDLLYK
jgi:hypothetical protein